MKEALFSFHRRIEWLHLFSYVVIFAAEILILWRISGTPQANLLRYVIFFGVVLGSLIVVRQRIIKPIQEMKQASLHIAAGNYHRRLPNYNSIELSELAQAFNQMASTLEATEQRRVALIGNVAHELRTPLGNIRATMEGLIDEVFEPNTVTFFSVQREVSRLQRLVHQLEALSQAESGQILLDKRQVDLDKLIWDVGQRLGVQFEDKGVRLHYDFEPNLPAISLDADRITQVLVNLLGNALQYTPSGGEVKVQVFRVDNALMTRITDTGIGIPAAELTSIFERFYRVDKSRTRNSGGNGIGLTIARHLIQAHGGHIWAESKGLGHGTSFTFSLPMRA